MKQADLFTASVISGTIEREYREYCDDLFAARERGKLGAQRAGQRAERLDPNWIEMAALYLALYADLAREPFLVEQASAKYPRRPLDGRAWGQAVRHAARKGWIKRVGYAPSASSNGSPKCLWAAGKK